MLLYFMCTCVLYFMCTCVLMLCVIDVVVFYVYLCTYVMSRVYNKRGECRTPNITNGKCIRKVT